MTDRGNTTLEPELDEQLAHEALSIVQGHGTTSHVEGKVVDHGADDA